MVQESTKMNVPTYEPWLGDEEIAQLQECIKDNWITGGKKVKEFERRIAEMVGVKYAMACTNGSSALLLGLKALGIKEGDEVLVPDFTFAASAFAVNWAGGTPVFVDVDEYTFNIDINSCERAITNKTKAIMPVHIYGMGADMVAVMQFAKKYNLKVIEDAAQGIGVSFMGKSVGSWGDVGCLSFYGDKTMTSGEGGMILSNNEEIYKKAFRINNQGRDGRGWYIHAEIGLNFRMTDLQAAIGLAQLDKLPEIIKRKQQCAEEYRKQLRLVQGVDLPIIDRRGFNVPFRHNILVNDPTKLQEYLKGCGIGTTRFFYPLHMQPCYKKLESQCPNSIFAYNQGLSLPSSTNLSLEQITYVCDRVKRFVR